MKVSFSISSKLATQSKFPVLYHIPGATGSPLFHEVPLWDRVASSSLLMRYWESSVLCGVKTERQRGRVEGVRAFFSLCTDLCENLYPKAMALVISPPPALHSLADQSLRFCTRGVHQCRSAAVSRRRRIQAAARSEGPNREFEERLPPGIQKQTRGGCQRRQFLAILLSSGLPLSQFGAFGGNASAVVADANSGGPSGAGADALQGEKTADGPIIGDLFGFDGLGKTPEEYVIGKVVALAQAGDGAVLFLGVDGFEIPLQLVVGPAEAMAVLTAVQERKSRRPLTHEAWGLSLAAVGWKVDRVVITGNEKDVFYSSVVLSNLSQLLSSSAVVKKSVDMRPSDGIALALRCRAPLFVRRKIAEEILTRKEELAGKTKADPLTQPGLQANGGASTVFVENLVSCRGEPFCTEYSSWMRRLQSL